MMERKEQQTRPAGLPAVRRRLESWRRSGGKGHRIPEPLWRAAAELARVQGVNPIARALGLDYYDLKRRAEAGGSARARAKVPASRTPTNGTAPSRFVEFEIPAFGCSPACSIELEDAKGSRLSIRLSTTDGVDVVALGKALWGARS